MSSGVTAAQGFRAAGVSAGLKSTGALDVALVINEGPHTAVAAVFTSNRVKAAPVLWSQQCVLGGTARAVVLNSGGANACTGPEGFADTHRTAEYVAEALGIGAIDVLVCSTGLIGERLPMSRLLAGVDQAVVELADSGGANAAAAIMTTDSVPKVATAQRGQVTAGGMAKGAGMLAPALATMLVVVTTDAIASAEQLDQALRSATRLTFDRLDSDGCMSTNDTVILMASGASGVSVSNEELTAVITEVCASLAAQLVADAEGSMKDIAIVVRGALTEDEAVTAGRAVSRSNLLKCAITGEDPNWGRVLAALGTADVEFEPDAVDVAINGVWVCRNGSVGESRELVDMSQRRVEITIELHAGFAQATIMTNDLTAAYVHENSAYST